MKLSEILNLAQGINRRKAIVAFLLDSITEKIPVNNRYQANLKFDKDLQILLKKEILKQKREEVFISKRYKNSNKKQTYLVLNRDSFNLLTLFKIK